MNKLILIPALLVAGCAAYADQPVQPSAEARERLDTALAGKVAGTPLACVRAQDLRGNRIIDERTIVFEGPGRTVYLNRLRTACAGMRPWHAIRRRTIGPSMCEGELVRAFNPAGGIEYSGCSLGEFVPYR